MEIVIKSLLHSTSTPKKPSYSVFSIINFEERKELLNFHSPPSLNHHSPAQPKSTLHLYLFHAYSAMPSSSTGDTTMTTTQLPVKLDSRAPVSLDKHGHVEDTCCTWAPLPPSPTQSSRRRVEPESWNPTAVASPGVGTEYFPPLCTLPNQSSHNYEEECSAHHHGSGVPQTDAAKQQHTRQRTNSWTPEDQKRLHHIRLIYGDSSHDAKPL